MMRILKPVLVAGAILTLTVPPVMAQTAPVRPSGPAAPGAPGAADLPAPKSSIPPQEKLIDGPVKEIDPAAKTVRVGWLLGLLSTTLEVTGDTQIAVGGTKASLMDLREGDKVKAAYEVRDGKNIAKSIEVAPPGATGGAGTPGTIEEPRGSSAPPSGSPTGSPRTP